MQNLANANAILKDDYLGPLRTALNTSTPLLTRLDKNSRDIAGRQAWIPVEMALNQGAGARAENAVLPLAGQGEYKELLADLKHYYGSLSVTGPVMRQTSKGERGSFTRIVDAEAKGIKKLLSLVLAHDFYIGHELAKATTEGPVNTMQLAADANMEYFKKDMLVDVVIAATGVPVANGTAITVTAVDKANKTITVDGAGVTTVAGTHIVVRDGTFGNTVTSLEEIIDDTADVYGVVTANFDEWKSTVESAFGGFTVSKLQKLIDDIVVFSGKYPTALYSDYTLQRKYFETLVANPRYQVTSGSKKLDGGFRSLEYSGGGEPIPWIADRLCPGQTIYAVHEPDIKVFSPGDFDWIDIAGDVWLPDILGATPKDNWKAVLFRDMELGAYNRNSHGKAKGVT